MITTNTGAKKLESSDNWREIFPNPVLSTAGAHNASVDAADRIQPEIAPIINGKRCSLGAASGEYVLLRNSTIAGKSDGAYQATKAIPANTDLDSTYLGSAITGGMVNELNNNITTKSKYPNGAAYFGIVVRNTAGTSNGIFFPMDRITLNTMNFDASNIRALTIFGSTGIDWKSNINSIEKWDNGLWINMMQSTSGFENWLAYIQFNTNA